MTRQRVARTGFRTATAVDGAQGLRAFTAVDPDLVLIDVLLPDLSGLELLVEKAGRPVSRNYLAKRLWGSGYDLAARRPETSNVSAGRSSPTRATRP
jgi:DNA-binding response OmpR family regulator